MKSGNYEITIARKPEMRVVMVSKYEWNDNTRRNELVEKGIALFHCFGINYEEFENDQGAISSAIVEWPNGTVGNVPVEHIRFLVPIAEISRRGP